MATKNYLHFHEYPPKGKTKLIGVGTMDMKLGDIKWYSPWRRYVFYPLANTLFDASCLTEVTQYIQQLMQDRKDANSQKD